MIFESVVKFFFALFSLFPKNIPFLIFFYTWPEFMATQKKVLGNALVQILGKVCTTAASLVIVKLLTGFGKEFYGNYLTAYEFLAFFGILADAGLFAIAVREIAKSPSQSSTNKIFGNIFSIRVVLIITVMLLAIGAAQLVPNYPDMVKNGIMITALSMGLTILSGTMSSVLQAKMKIQWFSLGLVVSKITLAAGIWWMIFKGHGTSPADFYTYLWIGVFANALFALIVWWFARKEVAIQLRFELDYWKKLLTQSLPFGLALILQTLYLRLDILLISFLLGSASVGMYGVSARVLEGLFVLSVFFGHAILPKISAEESNKSESNKTLTWAMSILLGVALPIMLVLQKFSTEIVEFISNEDFLSTTESIGADTVLSALGITVFFAFFNQLFTFALVAKNRQNYMLKINSIALLINGLGNLIFLPKFGIIAAAYTTIISAVFVFIALQKEIRNFFTLSWNKKLFTPILLANAILAIEIFATPIGNNFGLSAAVGAISYLGILAYFRKNYL